MNANAAPLRPADGTVQPPRHQQRAARLGKPLGWRSDSRPTAPTRGPWPSGCSARVSASDGPTSSTASKRSNRPRTTPRHDMLALPRSW
jgi:hypothetical protein